MCCGYSFDKKHKFLSICKMEQKNAPYTHLQFIKLLSQNHFVYITFLRKRNIHGGNKINYGEYIIERKIKLLVFFFQPKIKFIKTANI